MAITTEREVSAASIPDQFNVATYFVDRNVDEGRGDNVAIEYREERITYRQVLENVNRFGNALKHILGVRIEERVMLLLLDCPEYAYAFFGAIKIGAVPIPTSTLFKPADYEYILNDSRARVAVISEALLPQLQAIPHENLRYLRDVVVVGNAPPGTHSFEKLRTASEASLNPEPTSKDDSAFWLYSSGSTGAPKGCVHLHKDMLVCTEQYARGVLQITEADRCYSVAKLFFAYGLGNGLYFPFGVGATTVLFPGPPTPQNVFEIVSTHKPTLFFSVPTNYAMLLANETPCDFSSVRWGVSAGEALPPAVFERFQKRFGVTILDGIGSTEILHIFLSNQPGAIRPGSSGKPVDGYEMQIVDDDGQPVRQGEIGNLLVKGNSTCAMYWNKHDRTRDTIQGHWIRTGDKYSQDADGFYWYAGRGDDMLKVGGIWVSPVEVENALIEHAAVLEAGVVGREDQDRLVKPLAYVVCAAGYSGSPELARELQDFVRGKLADYKRPRWVEFVGELPKTGTGKTQRFKLRQQP
ncbi:MAG: benzoate-CoA ligase family protein [Chloroflexi bacterium]|nr:benzoate-CoA ligase family protein [Chloroflexota bacterium]